MVERDRNEVSDGIHWKCTDATCNMFKSIRAGSFFDKSRLTLQQWMMIIFYWVEECLVTKVGQRRQLSTDMDGLGMFVPHV